MGPAMLSEGRARVSRAKKLRSQDSNWYWHWCKHLVLITSQTLVGSLEPHPSSRRIAAMRTPQPEGTPAHSSARSQILRDRRCSALTSYDPGVNPTQPATRGNEPAFIIFRSVLAIPALLSVPRFVSVSGPGVIKADRFSSDGPRGFAARHACIADPRCMCPPSLLCIIYLQSVSALWTQVSANVLPIYLSRKEPIARNWNYPAEAARCSAVPEPSRASA